MARNKINDLNNHLFETIEKLKDGDMDVATAQAISDVGRTIIENAKVELKAMEMLGLSKGISSLLEVDSTKALPAKP